MIANVSQPVEWGLRVWFQTLERVAKNLQRLCRKHARHVSLARLLTHTCCAVVVLVSFVVLMMVSLDLRLLEEL